MICISDGTVDFRSVIRSGSIVTQPWEPDPAASFVNRLGDGDCPPNDTCPDLWELDNGDFAIIGRDLTFEYKCRMPDGVRLSENERLVVLPRVRLTSAKMDIPDV
jgi:hypothetical protein